MARYQRRGAGRSSTLHVFGVWRTEEETQVTEQAAQRAPAECIGGRQAGRPTVARWHVLYVGRNSTVYRVPLGSMSTLDRSTDKIAFVGAGWYLRKCLLMQ